MFAAVLRMRNCAEVPVAIVRLPSVVTPVFAAIGASMNLQFAWLFVLAFFFWALELVVGVEADRRGAAK